MLTLTAFLLIYQHNIKSSPKQLWHFKSYSKLTKISQSLGAYRYVIFCRPARSHFYIKLIVEIILLAIIIQVFSYYLHDHTVLHKTHGIYCLNSGIGHSAKIVALLPWLIHWLCPSLHCFLNIRRKDITIIHPSCSLYKLHIYMVGNFCGVQNFADLVLSIKCYLYK